MAEQLKLSLSDGVHHRPLPLHLSSDFIVGDVVLPVDFQCVFVTSHLKFQQSTLIIFLCGPRFCCIQNQNTCQEVAAQSVLGNVEFQMEMLEGDRPVCVVCIKRVRVNWMKSYMTIQSRYKLNKI